jgi:hypothetical protein
LYKDMLSEPPLWDIILGAGNRVRNQWLGLLGAYILIVRNHSINSCRTK